MKSVAQSLLEQIERAIAYLTEQAQINPAYNKLIDRLNLTAEKCRTTPRLTVKLLSPSASLAEKLKTKSQQDALWRSLFELKVISPIVNVGQIVRDCDLICLIYFYKHRVLEHHQYLIDIARQENIPLILLVSQPKEKTECTSVSNWLTNRDYSIKNSQLLIDEFDRFIDLNNSQQLACYRQKLVKLLPLARTRQTSKIKLEAIEIVKNFFQQEISHLRRQSDRPQQTDRYPYEQFGQTRSRLNREVQQTFAKIKQDLNHSKSDLLNPFNPDSLSFVMHQLVYFSHPTLVRETDRTYIYLVRDRSSDAEYLHDYVWQLCEQKIDEIMASQWWHITRLNVEYSTPAITKSIDVESNSCDLPSSIALLPQPQLDLERLIDRDCLKFNSRIVFDYHFTQSSWFRLFILSLVGLAIYLITWIYFGSGRSIGLVIVVFQLINLFIGQDLKTVKLKQHSKELKKIVDTKYQSLIRQIVDRATQVTISALDRESQLARQNIERAIALARGSWGQSSPISSHLQAKIKNLQQDRAKILSWFD